MTRILVGTLLSFLISFGYGQPHNNNAHPKLVVGIVVDQMRHEYLDRFYDKFGKGGFRRLSEDGFVLRNAHYNYVPTVTGPGHASIFTGTTPAVHGIIGNEWYDKEIKKPVNCVNDPRQKPVGSENANGDVSPWRLLSTTITDELKMATQKRARVIGMSFKDRGAVLPAGHMADAAYWFDDRSGTFVSSTFYETKLPTWVENFNKLRLPDTYLSQQWKTSYPINEYTESGPDDSPYEGTLGGKTSPTFPYDLKALRGKGQGYGLLPRTPFGNDFLTAFAKASIDGEMLGQHDWTDFLTISYSTTDIVGHDMGPNAVEVEDIYIRLDKNLEDLLNVLDQKVGVGNYTVFLTADHGVSEVVQYLSDNKVPSGYFNEQLLRSSLNEYLRKYFPDKDLIENISNNQITFDIDLFQKNPRNAGVDFLIASELISRYLISVDGVANVFTESVLRQSRYDEAGIKGMVIRGHHPKRSGDLAFVLEQGWYSSDRTKGSTHGSPYTYDTHVPVVFFGAGIPKGSTVRYHAITDIAPTLSMLLGIKLPSGCTGEPISEIFE